MKRIKQSLISVIYIMWFGIAQASGVRISSDYGQRVDPFTKTLRHHSGQDFAAPMGTPILAAGDGVVLEAKYHRQYGNMIILAHKSGLHTLYGHAALLFVKAGEQVYKGQKIALVGQTGRATGAHLHFEVRRNGVAIDPRPFIK